MSHHQHKLQQGGKKFHKHKKPFKKKVTKHQRIDDNVSSLKSKYESYNSKKANSFEDLPLSKETLKGLTDAGFTQPTEIQKESIVLALRGLDILGIKFAFTLNQECHINSQHYRSCQDRFRQNACIFNSTS